MVKFDLSMAWFLYRSIQIDYRQTFFQSEINSNYRYRIVSSEELISITETDLWKCRREATKLGVFDLCPSDLLKRGRANSGGFGTLLCNRNFASKVNQHNSERTVSSTHCSQYRTH